MKDKLNCILKTHEQLLQPKADNCNVKNSNDDLDCENCKECVEFEVYYMIKELIKDIK